MSTLHLLETLAGALALALALWLRPWRMLGAALLTPWLGVVVLLPWLWLLPQWLPSGVPMQFSGASLLVLMFGWPLAVCALSLVAVAVGLLGHASWMPAVSQWVWVGVVPATLALALGAALRRWLPPNLFVYTLGRGFLGTAACLFVSGSMYEWLYHLVGGVGLEQALVARWLMAWSDAFLTGMASAIFVAFVPQWLATWSDARYLRKPI